MPITRAEVEQVLVSRAKKRMEFVGMDVTNTGVNPDLADPIATALLLMGITPASFINPADADLTTIAVTDVPKLLDLAEVRLLENILGNMDKVTLTAASGTEQFGQFATDLEKIIARKQATAQKQYGIGVGTTESGSRTLSFQAKAT